MEKNQHAQGVLLRKALPGPRAGRSLRLDARAPRQNARPRRQPGDTILRALRSWLLPLNFREIVLGQGLLTSNAKLGPNLGFQRLALGCSGGVVTCEQPASNRTENDKE